MKDMGNSVSKVLGRTDIIAIGFGTMIGWSWVMMAPSWINEAGMMGALAAFVLGGLLILAVGLTYSELTSALPLSGGEFVFVYRAIGRRPAWLVGWIMSIAYIGVVAWEWIATSTAINYMFSVPSAVPLWEVAGYQVNFSWAVFGMAGAVVVTLINFFGTRPAVLFQVMATVVIIMVVFFMLFGGVVFGDVSNIGRTLWRQDGFYYTFCMVPAMLIGFNVIPQSAEEMNIAEKDIGKMVLVCIIFSIIWYCLLIIGISLAAPMEIRASNNIPLADVAIYLFNGEVFSLLVIIGGIFGILTTWNGFFIGATRLLCAMSRAGLLPAALGRIHKKYKTPYVAVLLVGGIAVVAPLLGMNALEWFINTSSLCSLFSYIFVVISYIVLKKKEPDLSRPFSVRGGAGMGIVILLAVCFYFLLYLRENFTFTTISPEFIIALLWLAVGAVITLLTRWRRKSMDDDEMELNVFGERFARRRSKS